MLYISRFVNLAGIRKVGVVDTDDGVETILTPGEVAQKASSFNLQIHGLEIRDGMYYAVKPFQLQSAVIPVMTKLLALQGINVVVYDSPKGREIAYIESTKDFTSPVTIRLSDFGDRCGDWCISGFTKVPKWRSNDVYPLTIILDSSLSTIRQYSFRSWSPGSIKYIPSLVAIDVSDLCDEFASFVYEAFYTVTHSSIKHQIIDNPERMKHLCAKLDEDYERR